MENENKYHKPPETISMYEHEEEVFRMERNNKRLFVALILSLILGFLSNGFWLYYESLYDKISYAQDGEGINNINTGEQGDVIGDGSDVKSEDT